MSKSMSIGGVDIEPGERKRLSIDLPRLYDFTPMSMPVEVLRGKKDGPTLFVSAAVHGDEINGVEIIRRLLGTKSLGRLRGTLVVVPIVNVYGFNTKSRYLPDRRDLNRSFPGTSKGSLASQLAQIFLKEIVSKCTHGIDLHTAAINRSNLPQIRACMDEPEVQEMADAFTAPVKLNSTPFPGSMRNQAKELGIPILVFEGGEALRFNESVIRSGLRGVLSVMRALKMLPAGKGERPANMAYIARSSHWVRAPHSGIFQSLGRLGERVDKGQILGTICDPFGQDVHEIRSRWEGIIIGNATLPLLNRGDATFHVATFDDPEAVGDSVEAFAEQIAGDGDPMAW